MSFKVKTAALAVSLLAAGGLALAASSAAHADPVGIKVVQNTAGEAGYFANDNGHTRFRDVQANVTVTPQIKDLNGTLAAGKGALGAELCDPNTGFAGQLGVWWNGSAYQVVYAAGNLAPAADPCIMTGLITPTPQQLLSSYTINKGDVLHFEIYWNPRGHHHALHFNACDVTQDICRQATVNTGHEDFYEAGIGAVTNAQVLTAPALNLLDSFTGTSFNYYSSTHGWNSINVPAHWDLQRADFINSSSQVAMSSNGSLNGAGNAFNLYEGSTSP